MSQAPVADQRVVKNSTPTLSYQHVDADGEAAAPPSAVTIRVQEADGTDVVAAGTATAGTGSSPRTYALTVAQTASLEMLTATWSFTGGSATTLIDIVGAVYCTIGENRAQPNMSDTAKFTDAEVKDARRWFEQKLEDYTRCAFVPRYRRERLDGTGTDRLLLSMPHLRSVRSVRVYSDFDTYESFTSDELSDLEVTDWGEIVREGGSTFASGSRNIVVEYEHGFDRPPADLKKAALVAIRDYLLNDNSGDRQISLQTQDGVVRNALSGMKTPFGLPFVDEVANRYDLSIPGVA